MAGNRFFNLSDLQIKKEDLEAEIGSEMAFNTYLNTHTERVARLEQLIRLPNEGEIFFLQTERSFNAFTFLPWVAQSFFIEEVFASTYSISRRVVEALQQMQQAGKLGQVTLLISDSMIKRNPQTIELLEGVAKHNANFRVKYYWNHSKVCLLKTDKHHLILEGSGNWADNAQLEQYILAHSAEVYNFRKEMFEF